MRYRFNKQSSIIFCFTTLIFSSTLFIYAQEKKISDSLSNILKSNKLSNAERIKLLTSLSYYHPSSSEALASANEALELAFEIKNDTLSAMALEEISHAERRIGNNAKSLEAALKALQIYETLNLPERQAASFAQLASNYISDGDYNTAITYLKKTKKVYSDTGKNWNFALTLINLGEAYRLAKSLDSATIYFQKAIELNKSYNSDLILGYASGNLGMVYAESENYKDAKEKLSQSIKILSTQEDYYSTSIYLAKLAEVHNKEGNTILAENKLLEAFNMAKQFGLKEQIRDFGAQLSSFYEEKKAFQQALSYQKVFQIYQDSLINKKNIQNIEQLKAGYIIGKRETEINRLNEVNTNRRNLALILGAALTILSILLYLIYRANKRTANANNKLEEQNKIISASEQEKALLLRELNHRVKNNLQMISSLLSLQEQELTGHPAKEALIAGQSRVEALSLIHQKLYQNEATAKVELKTYADELVLGLFFSYKMNFEPQIIGDRINMNVDQAIPIGLILNELTTNAIKYAYKETVMPSLKISFVKKAEQLTISVIDNGKGISENEIEKSNSFGIKLVTTLVEQLNGKMKIINSEGTYWQITLPIS